MADSQRRAWGNGLVPMMVMVMVPKEQRAAMLGSPSTAQLDALYDDAMARFDSFCFWYARPPRSPAGLREIARRLETYGSPEALRIAHAARSALAYG